MKVDIVPATLQHVMALRIRKSDRETYEKLYGDTMEHMLPQEISRSFNAWAGLIDGEVQAIWGVKCSGLLSDTAYIWFIGSDTIQDHSIVFLRHCRKEIIRLRGLFKYYDGYVLDGYGVSKKWLEWLGFSIEKPMGLVCQCVLRN